MNSTRIAVLTIVAVSLLATGCINFPINIPFLGPSTITVAVVGRASPTMVNLLAQPIFQSNGIVYAGTLDQSILSPGVLKNFNEVILMGQQECGPIARREIADYVKSGGKLIVIGDACTLVPSDNSAYGWSIGLSGMGDVMPVRIGAPNQPNLNNVSSSAWALKIVDVNHPVFNGVDNFAFSGTLTVTTPISQSNVLAFATQTLSNGSVQVPIFAVVESHGLLTFGKTIYYAYDPSSTTDCASSGQCVGSNMFLNTILYLKGAKG